MLLMNFEDPLVRAKSFQLPVQALRLFLRQLGASESRFQSFALGLCSDKVNVSAIGVTCAVGPFLQWGHLVGLRSITNRMFLSSVRNKMPTTADFEPSVQVQDLCASAGRLKPRQVLCVRVSRSVKDHV